MSQVSYEDESAAPIDADSKEDATEEASNNSEEKETAEIEEGDKGDSVEQASAEDQETEKGKDKISKDTKYKEKTSLLLKKTKQK